MKKQRTDGQETRQNLLVAASEVFAKKGYWEATNADICEKAHANTAAINYHFGSKENLYVEAWKYSFEKSIRAYPPDGGVLPTASIEERLRGRILSFMQRMADPESHGFEMVHKEMANPTGLLSETIQKAITPIEDDFKLFLTELLGSGASEKHIRFCHMSIMGQCFGPMLHLRHKKSEHAIPPPKDFAMDFEIEELANHITRFCLVGMNGIRNEIEKNAMTHKDSD
jgi:TetR/AcrR family transcriptional regulator, regulator of cefoperazone and chloramphenicol sensitivity